MWEIHLLFADVLGSISVDRLLELMWFAFQRHGATHFIIDSLMRIEALEEDYPAQSQFLTRLQDFAKRCGVHIHLVAHPRKTQEANRPAKMDIKGSSGIFAATDNMVVVSRNAEKDKARKAGQPLRDWCDLHDAEVTVEKQRETGWEGSYRLRYDPRTYSYHRCAPAGTGAGRGRVLELDRQGRRRAGASTIGSDGPA